MTGPSLTAWRRHGHGRFSCPDSNNAKENRGSDSGNGDNGTPNNRRIGEECDNGSVLSATAVNLLDSTKRAYQCRWEGGWQNNGAAADNDGNDGSVVKERHRCGG
jgi:hypothetical protein